MPDEPQVNATEDEGARDERPNEQHHEAQQLENGIREFGLACLVGPRDCARPFPGPGPLTGGVRRRPLATLEWFSAGALPGLIRVFFAAKCTALHRVSQAALRVKRFPDRQVQARPPIGPAFPMVGMGVEVAMLDHQAKERQSNRAPRGPFVCFQPTKQQS